MTIRFDATIVIEIEADLPDEFFIDDVSGHVITAAEYITKHIEDYREQILRAPRRCTKAIAIEEEEE